MVKYWVVRAEQTDANLVDPFESSSAIAIGFDIRQSLEDIACDELYARVRGISSIRTTPIQFHRFICEIQLDDVVFTPIKFSREVLVGHISGPYVYDPSLVDRNHPHTRHVEWAPWGRIRRDALPNRLQKRLNGRRTVFPIDSAELPNDLVALLERFVTGGRMRPRSTSIQRIAQTSDEWDSDDSQLFSMNREQLRERTSRHQQLVRDFAGFIGYEPLLENPIDYGALTQHGSLLAEMKTLDGTPEDERRQVRAAVGQLFYYARFNIPPEPPLVMAAVFNRQPTDQHIRWMESLGIAVVWQDGTGRFAAPPESRDRLDRVAPPNS